jgi:hypothetical protein
MGGYSATLSDALLERWSKSAERYQLIGQGLACLEDVSGGALFSLMDVTMAETLAELEGIKYEPFAPHVADINAGLGRIWLLYGEWDNRLRVTLLFDGYPKTVH